MGQTQAANLAENLRRLREARGLSQQQMARISGIPRPTWSSLESGSANPTLAVLGRAAAALQVSIEELIGPPRSTGTLYRTRDVPVRKRSGVAVRTLLPEPVPGLEALRMEIPAGAHMKGVPHTAGTREFLTCFRGRMVLTASGVDYELQPGDVVAFRGDQRHSYRNPGREGVVAVSIVAVAPPQP